MDVDLARPEFDGRWDKQAVKQEVDPLFNRSKHWKTKMDKVREIHRDRKRLIFMNLIFIRKFFKKH